MSADKDLLKAQLALAKIGGESIERQIFLCSWSLHRVRYKISQVVN
jgi:hypothetical protein